MISINRLSSYQLKIFTVLYYIKDFNSCLFSQIFIYFGHQKWPAIRSKTTTQVFINMPCIFKIYSQILLIYYFYIFNFYQDISVNYYQHFRTSQPVIILIPINKQYIKYVDENHDCIYFLTCLMNHFSKRLERILEKELKKR